jgi:phenylacetate-coenzyme A ligase PaaK-like adenylate-forming protein
MLDLEKLGDEEPFSLDRRKKIALYVPALTALTRHHYERCEEYRKILDVLLDGDLSEFSSIEDVPFIPVRLFKEYELLSVARDQVVKTMTSSGTGGQSVSKIHLDRKTARSQTKVLTRLVSSFTGKKRMPMLVIDSSSVVRDRRLFSARGAGILGFSMLGYDVTYVLGDDMQLDMETIQAFAEKHAGQRILLFGFTFMIWEHFYKALQQHGIVLPVNDGLMIHGGGWKKMSEQAVDNEAFRRGIRDVCGVTAVHNYYGMVEQTGSIFMECEAGYLHASIFSDVIIRDPQDFKSVGHGEQGLIQLLSLLPHSYPGHSILTEDIGEIVGEDDCRCGRLGKYFLVRGRIAKADLRGCSDTYAAAAH